MKDDIANHKLKIFHKFYPLFSALTGDLIFYVAINTIFMTVIKGLSIAEYASLATISSVFCLLFKPAIYFVIKKVGTISSLKIGSILMLLSSILLTFGTSYIIFVLGITILEIGFVFCSMDAVVLENNLLYENKENQYLKIKNKASLIYAIITAVMALLSGMLFSWNHYLPMYLEILTRIICVVFSFFMFDVSEKTTLEKKIVANGKVNLNKVLLLIFISYGVLYGSVNLAQGNSKLIMQETMLTQLTPEKIMYYLGIIIFASRLIRIGSNCLFEKGVHKFGDKIIVILSFFAFLFPVLTITSYYLPIPILYKVIMMMVGFFIILAIREPFNIYMQSLALRQCELGEQKR